MPVVEEHYTRQKESTATVSCATLFYIEFSRKYIMCEYILQRDVVAIKCVACHIPQKCNHNVCPYVLVCAYS